MQIPIQELLSDEVNDKEFFLRAPIIVLKELEIASNIRLDIEEEEADFYDYILEND